MMKWMFEKGGTLLELTVVLLILVALAGITIPYVAGTGQMARCQATDATMLAVKEAIMGGASGPGYYGDMLGDYPKTNKTSNDYNLKFLFEKPSGWNNFNPKTAVGWRGPYLQNGRVPPSGLDASFDSHNMSTPKAFDPNDGTTFSLKVHDLIMATNNSQIMDAWGRPIILQIPCKKETTTSCALQYDYARLVSAGPGSGIQPGDAIIDTQIFYVATGTPLPDASDRGDDRVLYLKKPDPYPSGNTPCNQL